MERTTNCSLVALVLLVTLLPVRSWCKEVACISPQEAKPNWRVSGDTNFKRFDDDIDYDSFMGLMGRRSAAQPSRHMEQILADVLGRRTRRACPCPGENLPKRRGRSIKRGRQRFQGLL